MTLARRPSSFGGLMTLRQAMDRLLDDTMLCARLPLDTSSTADALLVDASLHGFKPEDVETTVENGTLTIKVEDSADRSTEDGRWLVRKTSRGAVIRTVTLPTGLEADKAEATSEHGILLLRVPKAEQVKPKQIRIQPVTARTAKAVEPSDPTEREKVEK